jgi:uncharacterized protein involved in outer membrane biogenesis
MSNFIIALAVFVITIIGALFVVPYCIDWNGYRSVFEEEATRLLGREVRVGGAVNLRLLPTPYFRFEKVRIADASSNLQEPFFRTDSLAVKLTVGPLLRGAIEANEIEFQRPVLRLALDQKDGWNWQNFGEALANAVSLPTNVALVSVRISDGVLAVHAPDGTERTRFEGINAELSSPTLAGPYHLRGTFGAPAEQRQLKVATSAAEADGSLRFKATLSSPGAASNYVLDGRLLDIMGKPHIDGEVTARLPIADLLRSALPGGRAAASRPSAQEEVTEGREQPAFELKTAVRADAAGAELSDLSLSFEQEGRPQLITGRIKALWRDALSVEMNLSSRWLDLDRIAGAAEKAGPLASIVPLALRLRDLLPAAGRSHAVVLIDQANVGREAVSGVRLDLARFADKLEVRELRLNMPGGSRAELKGVVSGPPAAPLFDGGISLHGTSINRFFTWAAGGQLPFAAAGDGGFGVRCRLSITSGLAAVRDIVADLAGTAIGGSFQYRFEGRPEVSLLIEGPQLDARAFLPAGSTLADILKAGLPGLLAKEASDSQRKAGWRGTDAFLRLNAGQLITASRTYRDVAAELELKGGRLRVPTLKVAGDDGFSVELDGEVDDVARHPKGTLRGTVGIDTPQGLAPVLELFGVSETLAPLLPRAQALAPLRVAGAMTFGKRTSESADLTLDGEANGANVRISARFDGNASGWRAGAADITTLVESADAKTIAALLMPGRPPAASGSAPGRLLLKASGVPADGMALIASVDAGGDLTAGFRGRLVAAANGNTATGELELKAADAARIAALAGIALPLRLDGLPLAGSLRLSASRSGLNIDRLALAVGGVDVRGKVLISALGERQRLEARFDLGALTLANLLAPLLDQRLAITGAAEAAVSGRESLWPDEPFEPAAFEAFEGNIYLTIQHLNLTDGIGLSQVSLDTALSAGRLEVRRLEGLGLGGRLSASLRLEKVAGGAEVSGKLHIADARLEAIAADAGAKPPLAARTGGTLTGDLTFTGRGSSPRNTLSLLQGAGTLTLSDARLPTLWPGAVGVAAEAALKADPDKVTDSLRQGLAAALSAGQLPLPDTITLDIADGQLRMKPLVIDTDQGRASGAASLDLRTLTLESDWRLEEAAPAANAGDKPAPPAVTISYRGPAATLASEEPHIASDALEREIAVRRMERDVEELERLRKLDELRRREDADRPRRLPPPPVPVAPAAPQGRPATPG